MLFDGQSHNCLFIYGMNMKFHFGAGVKELLQSISEKQGRQMNSPESAKDIPKFIEFFKAWMLTFITEKFFLYKSLEF